MVKICSLNFPQNLDVSLNPYISNYKYPLYDFQKWALKGIIDRQHILITAPTGSGKTLPAEFAINYLHSLNKKIIYTSPIKALSNEKFYDFTNKYPHISVGLITGDINTNPCADVLIMTTEILLNKLFELNSQSNQSNQLNQLNETNLSNENNLNFSIDIKNELECVIFDEIHMINDEARGHVWEQCLMLLPPNIQIIGLSATLSNPELFACWIESIKNSQLENKKLGTCSLQNSNIKKEVYLINKKNRTIPLIHYSFITSQKSISKIIKNKEELQFIENNINKPLELLNEKNVLNNTNLKTLLKANKILQKNKVIIKRPFVLNKCIEYLNNNGMLPALCYVFSRKQAEKCAFEITTNLLGQSSLSTTDNTPINEAQIERECSALLRKLPNNNEYKNLPEYDNLLKLLEKGIAIHHAGLIPIFREMIELLFSKGYIKLLFCTETMSVGINLPVKTTIFTDVFKYNGEHLRMLYSHEYIQAAGRAGRLGKDNIGYVIHLNNLFKEIGETEYKTLLSCKPQQLKSKFKMNYNLLLNLIKNNNCLCADLLEFTNKSLINNDYNDELSKYYYLITEIETDLEKINFSLNNAFTPLKIIEHYYQLKYLKNNNTNINQNNAKQNNAKQNIIIHNIKKSSKIIEKQIKIYNEDYQFIERDLNTYLSYLNKKQELEELNNKLENLKNYFNDELYKIINFLINEGFIEIQNSNISLNIQSQNQNLNNKQLNLTLKGHYASYLREVPCLLFADYYEEKILHKLTPQELIILLSCFNCIKINDNVKSYRPNHNTQLLNNFLINTYEKYNNYLTKEVLAKISTNSETDFNFDLVNYVYEWTTLETVEQCKTLLEKMANEKGIFTGEFIKALLKINNCVLELEKLAEYNNSLEFLNNLKQIPSLILKFIVTNQSLYV